MRNPSPGRGVMKGSPAPSHMRINTYHLLVGEGLEDLPRSHLIVENGYIAEIGSGWLQEPDLTIGVVMPLPVNAHTHLNDYRVPEACIGLDLVSYVGSKGIKHALIQLFKEPLLPEELGFILVQYSFIADYQEHYWRCRDFKEELSRYSIEYVGLSRPPLWDPDYILRVLEECDGVGVSNPSRVPPWALQTIRYNGSKKIISSHISETRSMEERGSLHYLLNYRVKPANVVHGIYLEDWELKILAEEDIVLVVCPSSNIWFNKMTTNIAKALDYGVRIALGTDNAGCFHPDIWVEALQLHTLFSDIEPRRIVEMATVNGYKALSKEPYIIEEGRPAYFLAVDLGLANHRSYNIYSSIIKRIIWSRYRLIVKKNKVFILHSGFISGEK